MKKSNLAVMFAAVVLPRTFQPTIMKQCKRAIFLFVLSACGGESTAPPAPVASVSVEPSNGSIMIGATAQFSATTRDAAGNVLAGRAITWQSSNVAIGSVSTIGLVTGVSAGTTAISATSEGKSGSVQVTILAPVASLVINPPTSSVLVGATAQLNATPYDAQGNALQGRTASWLSGNSTIVSVSTSGLLTGLLPGGPVTITAVVEGKSATAQVTVLAPVSSVTVSPPTVSVAPGATTQLAATTRDAQGNTLTGRVVTWSSSNSGIASVSASGAVSGVIVGGPVTITATSEGKSGTAQVTVTTPITSVTLNGSLRVKVGDSYTYTATARTADGTTVVRPVTWSVADQASASITSSGVLVPLRVGTITIRATIDGTAWEGTLTAYDWTTFGAYPTLGVVVPADVLITNKFGTSEYPTLVIGCSSGDMVIYVGTTRFVTANGLVSYAFDSGAIISQTWVESSDFSDLIYPPVSNSVNIAFANTMKAARTFIFAFTEFQGSAKATSFRVTGLTPILTNLISSCQLRNTSIASQENEMTNAAAFNQLRALRGDFSQMANEVALRRAAGAEQTVAPRLQIFEARQSQQAMRQAISR